jgi:hypothetical protein
MPTSANTDSATRMMGSKTARIAKTVRRIAFKATDSVPWPAEVEVLKKVS